MILVTGGAGLVGRELIARLLAGNKKIRAIYNKTPLPDFKHDHIEQFPCNVLDVPGLEEAMTGIEQVYHCAAIVSFNPAKKREMFRVNIQGTANIVNAALDAGVKKMVHVSSVSALGRIRENETVTESMNWSEETSNSNYGKSKFFSELEVWRGIAEGLPAVIVNPAIILGAGNWNEGSTRLFQSAYREFPWYTNGETGFVDVQDVARAMIQLMENEISGERFILSAENRSYKNILDLMSKGFDKKPPHKKVTPFLSDMVWRLEAIKQFFTGKDALVTKETARTAMAKVNFENSKLIKIFPGWEYQPLEDTINRICAALLDQYKI
jgi:nucleoside-diphosphate-sugar epimerase